VRYPPSIITSNNSTMAEKTPHLYSDVVIIGAGFSGIDLACQLQRKLGLTNYVIYDRATEFGGACKCLFSQAKFDVEDPQTLIPASKLYPLCSLSSSILINDYRVCKQVQVTSATIRMLPLKLYRSRLWCRHTRIFIFPLLVPKSRVHQHISFPK